MSPLYQTGRTPSGTILMGGLWKLKTEHGFPVDLAVLECRQRGWLPDWAEMLACAGSVKPPAWEFDAALIDLRECAPEAEEILKRFNAWFSIHERPGDSFQSVCERLLGTKAA